MSLEIQISQCFIAPFIFRIMGEFGDDKELSKREYVEDLNFTYYLVELHIIIMNASN